MYNYLRIYWEKFFFLEDFMKKNLWKTKKNNPEKQSHEFAWSLFINTCKCIAIAHILVFGYEFSKGKQFYLVYLKASVKASLLGFLYSVYFNDEKLELFLAKKNIQSENQL